MFKCSEVHELEQKEEEKKGQNIYIEKNPFQVHGSVHQR
jgi:hypothetical protein